MNDELFNELLQSVVEGGAVSPSRKRPPLRTWRRARRSITPFVALAVLSCAGRSGVETSGSNQLPACPQHIVAVPDTGSVDLAALDVLLERSGRRNNAAELEIMATSDRPEMVNRSAVARTMERNYPRELRTAGLGGVTLLLVLIDEDGRVASSIVDKTSGRVQIDLASAVVAEVMEFTPSVITGCRAAFAATIPIMWRSVDRPPGEAAWMTVEGAAFWRTDSHVAITALATARAR